MAKRLKDYYGADFAALLAGRLAAGGPFDREGFVRRMEGALGGEGFLARQDLYVDALEAFLGADVEGNLRLFSSVWGEELRQETGMFLEGFWLWPLSRYATRHALACPAASYVFIEGLTRRHTGEFAIRPLLLHRTRETMERMEQWSRSPSVHVRRLASEGLRIALPWAKQTTAALSEWELYAGILTRLKDDASRFVQKSVGNNLNDLYKHAPALAEKLVAGWEASEGLSTPAKWVIRHGRRGLIKQAAKNGERKEE